MSDEKTASQRRLEEEWARKGIMPLKPLSPADTKIFPLKNRNDDYLYEKYKMKDKYIFKDATHDFL